MEASKTKEPNDWLGVKQSTKQRFLSLKRKNEYITDKQETQDSFLNKLLDLYNKMFKKKIQVYNNPNLNNSNIVE